MKIMKMGTRFTITGDNSERRLDLARRIVRAAPWGRSVSRSSSFESCDNDQNKDRDKDGHPRPREHILMLAIGSRQSGGRTARKEKRMLQNNPCRPIARLCLPLLLGMGQIHIGRTAVPTHVALNLPELRYGEHTLPNVHGYLIKTLDPNTLVIRGAELQREQRWWFHPPSVSYGLIGFLRRYAGIEQYWSVRPGQIGEVIPEKPTLRVPEIEWRDWPYFVSMVVTMVSAGQILENWDRWYRQTRIPHIGVRRYWADVRMGDSVASINDVHRIIDDARTSADLARAMGEHIRNVLEQEPFDRYLLFQRLRSPGMTYTDLRSGTLWPESRLAIAGGFGAVAAFLHGELGPEEAVAWLRRAREQEENAELIAALEAAEIRASGIELTNLLEDGGFEQLGKRLAPDDRDLAPFSSVELDVDPGEGVTAMVPDVGLRVWYPDRTPFTASVTWEDAHSGEYSLRLEHIDRGRLSYHVSAEPDTRYRISLAIKHNDAPGRYRLEANVRPNRDQPIKSLARIQVPELPDQWQHLVVDITTPDEAWLLNLNLHIDDQTANSHAWVDDVFIGAYPKWSIQP